MLSKSQMSTPFANSSKNFIVTAILHNHNWNGGELRYKKENILAKNKTSAISKFMKIHRSYMNKFDHVNIECKLDVL